MKINGIRLEGTKISDRIKRGRINRISLYNEALSDKHTTQKVFFEKVLKIIERLIICDVIMTFEKKNIYSQAELVSIIRNTQFVQISQELRK